MAKPTPAKPKAKKQFRSTNPRHPAVIERRPLTPAEAADYLGVTERWVRRAVQERRVPFMKVGRLLRFHPDDLDSWLNEQRVPAER